MPPKRPRVVKPKPRKLQPALGEEPQQPKLKLNLKSRNETAASVSASHLLPTAPQTPDETPDDEVDDELFETGEQSVENEQGLRRGLRKRTKSQAPDLAYGSEMESLIDSALIDRPAKRAKVKDDDDEHIASSPPPMASSAPRKSILKVGSSSAKPLTRKVQFAAETDVHIVPEAGRMASSAPSKSTLKPPGKSTESLTRKDHLATEISPTRDSSSTVQGDDTAPARCTDSVASDVAVILNVLRSTSEIQVDLPNLTGPDGTKNYTAAVLTELYIQCYEGRLWNYCDLIADTWIRTLQKANKRSHRKQNKKEFMWRENRALEQIFAQKGLGFKKKAPDYGLDVEDPGMDRDVSAIDPERLRDLFAHTTSGCGARVLWADAMALGGQNMEHEMTQHPAIWPKDLVFEIMCSSLRLVGRKLTLKIEEKYEGAWCRRYHEHAKHGRACYRKLAWQQEGRKSRTHSRQASVVDEYDDNDSLEGSEFGGERRVHFEDDFDEANGLDASVLVDYEGEDDTGPESEEEG